MGDFEKFYNAALGFLSYRPRSEKEVRDRLKLKTSHFAKASRDKQNSKIIDEVIEKLKKQKFINDEEFARLWIESRMRFKPRSWRLIKAELKQKGIDPETINNLQLTINIDLESAKKLVEKKMGRFRNTRLHLPSQSDGGQEFGMTREKVYQKLGRYLASKGFNWDIIKKSIDEILDKGV